MAPGSELKEPSGDRSTTSCVVQWAYKHNSKGLGISQLCSQAARAKWATAEVLYVAAAKFASWTSNTCLCTASLQQGRKRRLQIVLGCLLSG
jgi:hypothetical protein